MRRGKGAEDASLRCACVHDESGGDVISDLDVLGCVVDEVQYPGAHRVSC